MRSIALVALMAVAGTAFAQKPEGSVEVRVEHRDGTPGEARVEVLRDLSLLGERYGFGGIASGLGERVGLSVKDLSLRDAIAALLGGTKVEYVIDEDVPKDLKVTATFQNVRLATALDTICQSLGIGWTQELREGKWRVRITAKPGAGTIVRALTTFPDVVGEVMKGNPMLYWSTPENRSTFVCPHCKGQAQVLRPRQQTRCPKCGRAFQGDWQFCPYDGAKRPAAPGGWRFCPFCGKAVEKEKAAVDGGAS